MFRADRIVRAVASAVALFVVVTLLRNPTPIDRVLPLIGIIVIALAFVAERFQEAIELAVPLLAIAAFTLPDERTRLLAYGVIVAGAFAGALVFAPRTISAEMTITIAAIVVLRWLPRPELWRELVVMTGAVVLLLAVRSPMLAIVIALLTPTHPGRWMLVPFVVIPIAFGVRRFAAAFFESQIGRKPPHSKGFAYAVVLPLFVLWPWSGIVARGLPSLLRSEKPRNPTIIGRALAANETIDIPFASKRGVIVTMSGANVARMKKGRAVATINGRIVTIGDIADFGFMRREQFFASRNGAPKVPADDIRGYGIAAFLYGAGRVRVGGNVASVRITAAPDLPSDARIEVESVEAQ